MPGGIANRHKGTGNRKGKFHNVYSFALRASHGRPDDRSCIVACLRGPLLMRRAALHSAALAAAFIVGGPSWAALSDIVAPAPIVRLVGYGCEGAAGPIFAQEESDFPACASIEIWER